MVVDTGATITSLTQRAARAIGIPLASLNYSVPVNTANGIAFWAPYTLDRIHIGPITQTNLDLLVSPDETSFSNLLGMNFLNTLQHWEVRGGNLILRGKTHEVPSPSATVRTPAPPPAPPSPQQPTATTQRRSDPNNPPSKPAIPESSDQGHDWG